MYQFLNPVEFDETENVESKIKLIWTFAWS
jgi:predicted methyltransferase MtxX (methanogen marker protein 4)